MAAGQGARPGFITYGVHACCTVRGTWASCCLESWDGGIWVGLRGWWQGGGATVGIIVERRSGGAMAGTAIPWWGGSGKVGRAAVQGNSAWGFIVNREGRWGV